MKNIKINLYLVAFFAILVKSLVFTMTGPEMGALIALLVKLGFDSYLSLIAKKEEQAPLEARLKAVEQLATKTDNSIKLMSNIRR